VAYDDGHSICARDMARISRSLRGCRDCEDWNERFSTRHYLSTYWTSFSSWLPRFLGIDYFASDLRVAYSALLQPLNLSPSLASEMCHRETSLTVRSGHVCQSHGLRDLEKHVPVTRFRSLSHQRSRSAALLLPQT